MTAPKASVAGDGAAAPRAALRAETLKKRADFQRTSRARTVATPGFILQARRRRPGESGEGIRVGFTCSRKVGNAGARNRARRRLREIARLELPAHGRPGWDYVLVGRAKTTATRDFAAMRADLRAALARVHK